MGVDLQINTSVYSSERSELNPLQYINLSAMTALNVRPAMDYYFRLLLAKYKEERYIPKHLVIEHGQLGQGANVVARECKRLYVGKHPYMFTIVTQAKSHLKLKGVEEYLQHLVAMDRDETTSTDVSEL